MPAGGREIGGARSFEVDGVTVRIQHIGDTICCTASTMPLEAMAQLFSMPGARQRPPHGPQAQPYGAARAA